MTLNKYLMMYILPVICTFGFSGSNSFNSNLAASDEKKCFVQRDIYLSIDENKPLNEVEKIIFAKKIGNYISFSI